MSQTNVAGGTLVVFPGALGDFVCFLPALRALREASDGPLTVLCDASLAALARLAGAERTIPLSDVVASWLFSSQPPQEAERLYGSFTAIHSFSGAGIPEVERNLARWSPRAKLSPFRSARGHAAEHFLREVRGRDVPVSSIVLEIPDEIRREVRVRHGAIMNNRPLLLVHPGSGGKAKRWSEAGFRFVIEAWQRDAGEVAVVLGPAESEEAEAWRRSARIVVPQETLELAALLAEGDGYLGNDSGPTHLAAAVGARGVALFGPSDPARWRPLGRGVEVVRPEPWASFEANASDAAKSLVRRALTRAASGSIP